MSDDLIPYASIYEALGELEDYIHPDWLTRERGHPTVVRIVLRDGQQYETNVRKVTIEEITLVNLPPHGATRRFKVSDITYLAIPHRAPESRRLLTIALTTLGIGDLVVLTGRLFQHRLGRDSLILLLILVATFGFVLFGESDKPGSNMRPWVVIYCEPAAAFTEPTSERV